MTTTVEAAGVVLVVPPGWEQVDVPGIPLAVAGPERQAAADGSTFRASVNAQVAEAPAGTDVRELGTQALAATTVTVAGAHVVAYDVWPSPAGVDGRRLEFVYQQGSVALRVVQWFVVEDGWATTITATCPVAELLRLGPVLDGVVATAQLPRRSA